MNDPILLIEHGRLTGRTGNENHENWQADPSVHRGR